MNNSSEKKRKRVLPSSSSSRTRDGDVGTPPKATRKEARRQHRTSKTKQKKDSSTTTTFHGGLSLTPNTVRSLVRGEYVIDEEASSPVIVRIRLEERALIADNNNDRNNDDEGGEGKPAIAATMTDGFNHYKVLILNKSNELETCYRRREKDLVVAIEGYVTSEGSNSKYHLHPIISITNYTILETRDKNDGFSFGDKVIFPRTQQPARFHTGTIGSFLDQRGPFLTTDELAGSALLSETFFQDAPLTASGDDTKIQPSPSHSSHMENLDTVGKFLARHIAMVTLQSSSQPSFSTSRSSQNNVDDSNSSSETPSKKPLTDHAVQNYNAALREFTTSQMDRQKASLESNAGRETADRAILVRERHDSALNMALNLLDDSKQQRSLTPSLLQQLHKELLRDLHPEAGQFRTKMVRAGRTKFAPPDRIETEVTLLCNSLNSLEQRLDLSNPTHAVLFASMAMYGVVDIHPFLDGNGRLSRIIANWALKKVPFPINLFVTPAQRSEYVLALEKTRHFLSLTRTHGTVSRDEVLESIKTTGIFSSLIRLLMDRIARSVTECNRVFEEKSYLAAEAAEDRAARRARERSAQGTCIICFDEKPNIATLCCGKAVHLNCIAEWLSGNNSCPVCRSDIPSIHGRFNRATSVRQRDTETSDDDDDDEDDSSDDVDDDDDDEEEGAELENGTNNIRNLQGSDDVQITVSGRSFREALRDERLDTLDRVVAAMLGSYNTTTVDRNEEDDDDYDSEEIEDHTTTMSEDGSEEHQERDQRNEDTTSTTTSDDDDDDNHRYTRAAMFAESSDDDDDEENEDFQSPEDHGDETALEDETEPEEEETAPAEETTTTVDDETNPEDTATDETTTQEEAALLPPPFEPRPAVLVCDALYCRNRRAADCVNTLCGRCCVLAGLRHCPRHNS